MMHCPTCRPSVPTSTANCAYGQELSFPASYASMSVMPSLPISLEVPALFYEPLQRDTTHQSALTVSVE